MKKQLFILSFMVALTIMPVESRADGVILDPVSATTNMGSFLGILPIDFTIDQSGLSSPYISGVTDFDSYVATARHTSEPGTDWASSIGITTGWIEFDLGGVFGVNRAAVWNYGGLGEDPLASIHEINLWASTDGIAYDYLGNYLLTAPAPTDVDTLAQVLYFGATNAQFIRMDIISNYGSSRWTGLGEAAFGTVPEPGAFLLFGTGLGMLGLAAYRRRRK